MKRILFAAFFAAAAINSGAQSVLKEGTIVTAVLKNDITGKNANPGESIAFELGKDIIQHDSVIIASGAKIVGTVTAAAGSKGLGKKGVLEFTIDYLYLPSGKVVKLKKEIASNTKGRGAGVVAGAVLLSPAFLLMHGKQAKFEKGTAFEVYVAQDATL